MRLAFCIPGYFPFGGLQRSFMQIASELKRQGHEIVVFAPAWEGEQPFPVQLIRLRAIRNHARTAEFSRKVLPLLEGSRYAGVIGFLKMPGLDVYYAADPCFQARAHRERSRLYRLGARYRHFTALERTVFEPAGRTHILALTETGIADYRDCYQTPYERFHLLPPGISRGAMASAQRQEIRAAVRRELALAEAEKLLVTVGSGFKTKGLDRTLRAVAALPRTQRVRLLVIGRGESRPYRWLAWRLGVAGRVQWLGARHDVARFLQAADLLVHPAYTESAGSVLLEALVAGLPVLTTANCGYAFHVQQADAGVVAPVPFQQDALNAGLARMLAAPDWERWSRNGIAYGQTQDLYSRAPTAARIIMAILSAKR